MKTSPCFAISAVVCLMASTHHLAADIFVQYSCPQGSEFAPTTVASGFSAGNLNNSGSESALQAGFLLLGTLYFEPYLPSATTGGATAADAVANNRYFQFTLTPNVGVSYSLSSLAFDVGRGGASTPRGWVLRSSLDNYSSTINSSDIPTVQPSLTHYSVDLSGIAFQSLDTAISLRLYGYTPAFGSGLFYDNITLTGSSVPEPSQWMPAMAAFLGILVGAREWSRRRRWTR